MEHDCPICGKRIYNHKGACYKCREKMVGPIGGPNKIQEDKWKGFVFLVLAVLLGFGLYSAYNYIRTLGFNHNSAIAIMITIPLIALILIFRGKRIYWALHSNRKVSPWLWIIILLIIIVLFLQFKPIISTNISNPFENSKVDALDYKALCEKDCGGSLVLNSGLAYGVGYEISDYGDSGNKHVLLCACSSGMKMIPLD